MQHTLQPRLLFAAVLLSACVATLGLPGGSAQAGCAARQPVEIARFDVVTGHLAYDCVNLQINAEVLVASDGWLEISDSGIAFGPSGRLRIQDGGILDLEAAPIDLDRVTGESGSRIDQAGRVKVTVQGDDPGAAAVWAWDARGEQRVECNPGADGSCTMALPLSTSSGGQATDFLPWRIHARAPNGTVATASLASAPAAAGPVARTLDLTNPPVAGAPAWAAGTAGLRVVPESPFVNRTVALAWDAAVPLPTKPIDSYVIQVLAPGGDQRSLYVGAAAGTPHFGYGASEAGVHRFRVQAIDASGAASPPSDELRVAVDLQDPLITLRLSPDLPDGGTWFSHPPTFTVEGEDLGPSGLQSLQFRLHQNESWTPYEGPSAINRTGLHLLQARALDKAGNSALASLLVPVDIDAPTIAIVPLAQAYNGWFRAAVEMQLEASDNGSGIQRVEFGYGGDQWFAYDAPTLLQHAGARTIVARAVDHAGHSSQASSVIRIDDEAPYPGAFSIRVSPGGNVELDWSAQPPQDAVSGVSRTFIDAKAPGGEEQRFTVPQGNTSYEVAPVPGGRHEFRLHVLDAAGNEATTAWSGAMVNSEAGVHGSTGNVRVRGLETIRFEPREGFEAQSVLFTVDGAAVATDAASPFQFEWNTAEFTDGPHQVRAVATGVSGEIQTQAFGYEVRNAYPKLLADHMAAVAGPALLDATATACGAVAYGLSRRTLRAYAGLAATRVTAEALPRVASGGRIGLTLSGAAVLALAAVAALPWAFGAASLAWTRFHVILGACLLVAQLAALAYLGRTRSILAAAPRLERTVAAPLEFDVGVRP